MSQLDFSTGYLIKSGEKLVLSSSASSFAGPANVSGIL